MLISLEKVVRDMIHFFNRKELMMTYDLRQVNDIREILRANRIDYHVKASYPRSASAIGAGRARTASFGPVRQQERFTVYVHKADYDRALYLLREHR